MKRSHITEAATPRWLVYSVWLILLGLLTYVFNGWLEQGDNPNQSVEVMEYRDGVREAKLQRNRHGHYVVNGEINDHPVTFMLDTGASDISIPAEVASAIGLRRGAERRYHTANGTITAYTTRLESVSIGAIRLDGLRASINPHMKGEGILLGMNFLKQIEFSQRGNQLTLRQYPEPQ
ncbi:hypothetical protein BOW53_05735 [Solemya pervernicosa gill symbiont]|uniref:Aspartyl protease n=2 Tax=Gammaproteobacteria incertae sedis TaxID=118884 RepID=A0A1T2L7J4_9GAMM|nr:TIGR02281 family clan AA aspartic protease [Candidatus Reidiella endopervernicosa]OOZ41022.1 hypothetical protein BOW53_05735 [Solemya pervernicosa gill symbiont]QKQ25083.1 retroviral-like aspartic protease family protein [Candidatus Reidiella endopervernicosa]